MISSNSSHSCLVNKTRMKLPNFDNVARSSGVMEASPNLDCLSLSSEIVERPKF